MQKLIKKELPQLPRELWSYILKIKSFTEACMREYQYFLFEIYDYLTVRNVEYVNLITARGLVARITIPPSTDFSYCNTDDEEFSGDIDLLMTTKGLWDTYYHEYVYNYNTSYEDYFRTDY